MERMVELVFFQEDRTKSDWARVDTKHRLPVFLEVSYGVGCERCFELVERLLGICRVQYLANPSRLRTSLTVFGCVALRICADFLLLNGHAFCVIMHAIYVELGDDEYFVRHLFGLSVLD